MRESDEERRKQEGDCAAHGLANSDGVGKLLRENGKLFAGSEDRQTG